MMNRLKPMRTTVEIRDDHRAKLLELAARRGEKGFSRIVEEALDRYLATAGGRDERVRRALSAVGSFDEEAAQRLEESARSIRATWR
jgi:hypothetical protein